MKTRQTQTLNKNQGFDHEYDSDMEYDEYPFDIPCDLHMYKNSKDKVMATLIDIMQSQLLENKNKNKNKNNNNNDNDNNKDKTLEFDETYNNYSKHIPRILRTVAEATADQSIFRGIPTMTENYWQMLQKNMTLQIKNMDHVNKECQKLLNPIIEYCVHKIRPMVQEFVRASPPPNLEKVIFLFFIFYF